MANEIDQETILHKIERNMPNNPETFEENSELPDIGVTDKSDSTNPIIDSASVKFSFPHAELSAVKQTTSLMKRTSKKSALPLDIVKVLKNVVYHNLLPTVKGKAAPCKIIVAKLPTSVLKEAFSEQDIEADGNKDRQRVKNKVSPDFAKMLKRIILCNKASSIVKKYRSHTTGTQIVVADLLNESIRKNSKLPELLSNLAEKRCVSTSCLSKYLTDIDSFQLDAPKDIPNFEESIFATQQCLLITLPCTPGYENEITSKKLTIALEFGTMSHFELTEECTLEKEFNKMFHYFSCPNLSEYSSTDEIKNYIFLTVEDLLNTFPLEEALKLVCNCSLCWFLYVRGKIFSTHYPGKPLSFTNSPLASHKSMAVRTIEITKEKSMPFIEQFNADGHYFLCLRFKRGGKRRDLSRKTALCDSFKVNGIIPIRRSRKKESWKKNTDCRPNTPKHNFKTSVTEPISKENTDFRTTTEQTELLNFASGEREYLCSHQTGDINLKFQAGNLSMFDESNHCGKTKSVQTKVIPENLHSSGKLNEQTSSALPKISESPKNINSTGNITMSEVVAPTFGEDSHSNLEKYLAVQVQKPALSHLSAVTHLELSKGTEYNSELFDANIEISEHLGKRGIPTSKFPVRTDIKPQKTLSMLKGNSPNLYNSKLMPLKLLSKIHSKLLYNTNTLKESIQKPCCMIKIQTLRQNASSSVQSSNLNNIKCKLESPISSPSKIKEQRSNIEYNSHSMKRVSTIHHIPRKRL